MQDELGGEWTLYQEAFNDLQSAPSFMVWYLPLMKEIMMGWASCCG